jgi:3-keto-L-gulonate-6-phosphate decarboxylase
MNPKQDRQGVRTASDLERKYKLGQDYDDIKVIASGAQNTAAHAANTANSATAVAMSAKATADKALEVASNASTSDVGLSVVDGLLCVTYIEKEVE